MSDKRFTQNVSGELPPSYSQLSHSAPNTGHIQNGIQMYASVPPAAGFQPIPHRGYPNVNAANVSQAPVINVIVYPDDVRNNPFPTRMICQICHQEITTVTRPVVGGYTWIMAGMMALLGLVCGCCLLPFYSDCCKDVEHHCPFCGSYIGTYQRMAQGRRRW
ncbi:hypothetical protein B4U79_12763 [Dinothrombium tinctorium]|uniref:LITAF domain-containing protein n=1 Tax=Dinothrombium tinctorium TaxID=1965070 RepID=A0A443QR12_9ACAR|nr:hypothetical protein B4U79_12763 [Dinothrombium tinctorium]